MKGTTMPPFLNRPIHRLPYLGLILLATFLDTMLGKWFGTAEATRFLLIMVATFGEPGLWLFIIGLCLVPPAIVCIAVMKRGAALGWSTLRYIQCGIVCTGVTILFVASFNGVAGQDYVNLTNVMRLFSAPLHLVLLFTATKVAPEATETLVAAE
jgi:hypothetical protein